MSRPTRDKWTRRVASLPHYDKDNFERQGSIDATKPQFSSQNLTKRLRLLTTCCHIDIAAFIC